MAISGAGTVASTLLDWWRRRNGGGATATPPAPSAPGVAPGSLGAVAPDNPSLEAPPTPAAPVPDGAAPPQAAPLTTREAIQAALDGVTRDIEDLRKVTRDPTVDAYTRGEAQKSLGTYLERQNALYTQLRQIDTDKATAKGPKTIQKQEQGPDGNTYLVTYDLDAQGNEKWNGQRPVKLDLGAKPGTTQTINGQLYTISADGTTATPVSGVGPAVKLEQRNGRTYASQDNGLTWQPAGGLPGTTERIQGADGRTYSYDPSTNTATPVDGIGPAVKTQQVGGTLYISKDNGASWEPARGLPSQPQQINQGGVVTGVDPLTGQQVYQTDVRTPEQQEAAQLQLEQARRGTLPANAVAAYSQERARLQARGQQELDRLTALQQQGAMSAAEAQREFERFFRQSIEAPLSGVQTQAEEYLRAERERQEQAQREEDWRAAQFNRQREQAGLEAAGTARQQVMSIAPQVRTQEVLTGLGNIVSGMSARAKAPSAEAAAAVPQAAPLSPGAFSIENFRGVVPDIESYAKQASDRALAAISPAVAARVGRPLPQLPSLPDLTGLLAQVPYQGLLSAAPKGATPLPGQEAIDLGPMGQPGMGRTYYSPTSYLDWRIPG